MYKTGIVRRVDVEHATAERGAAARKGAREDVHEDLKQQGGKGAGINKYMYVYV